MMEEGGDPRGCDEEGGEGNTTISKTINTTDIVNQIACCFMHV